jgi:hypothetical protein
MNKIWSLILMLCFMFVSLSSKAAETDEKEKDLGFWFEAQAVSGKKNASSIIGWYEHDFTDTIGFYGLAVKESDGYREFYVGPKFKLSDRLTVGVGIGREAMTDLNSVRRNFYYDASWEKFSSFGTFENGGSGRWHKVTVTYKLTEKIGAGVMDQSVLGQGPRLEYKFENKNKVTVWGAMLHSRDTGGNTSVIGINFSF